jgi:hypothetical protein
MSRPLGRIDGTHVKHKKKNTNKEYSSFCIVPYKSSLVIVAVKKSGRIDVLFSMDHLYPNFVSVNDKKKPFVCY